MNTKICVLLAGLLLAGNSKAKSTVTDSGSTVDTITSVDQVEMIIKNTQWDFWQLVPPTDDPFYLHPEQIVRVVDWNSKDWPKPLLKQMYAEMKPIGSYGAEYPFYRLTVIEDRSGDVVFYNAYNEEVWRVFAPKSYNPYRFAFYQYGADSEEELTEQQKLFGRSSNVGTELILIPVKLASLYEEDTILDSSAMPLAVEPVVATESSVRMLYASFLSPRSRPCRSLIICQA